MMIVQGGIIFDSLNSTCYNYLYDVIESSPDYVANINSFGIFIIEVRQPDTKGIQFEGGIGRQEFNTPKIKKQKKNISNLINHLHMIQNYSA